MSEVLVLNPTFHFIGPSCVISTTTPPGPIPAIQIGSSSLAILLATFFSIDFFKQPPIAMCF